MPSAREVARRQARDIRYRTALEIKRQVADQARQAVYKAYLAGIQQALLVGKEMTSPSQTDEDTYRQAMFRRLGELAQRSMVASYAQLVTAREGPASVVAARDGGAASAGVRVSGSLLPRPW